MKKILISTVVMITGVALMSNLLFAEEFNKNKVLGPKSQKVDPAIMNWLTGHVSALTQLPLSFQILPEHKPSAYQHMGGASSVEGIIERVIVEEGLVIYDGAVRQIVLTMLGEEKHIADAQRLTRVCWEGGLGELFNLRAGYPINTFIYDEDNPESVSSDLSRQGQRGFMFRIINAHGRYRTQDPLDGKTEFEGFPTWPTIHWEDWKPIAGENAWVAMAAVHLYHKKYYDPTKRHYRRGSEDSVELRLAEELARAAMFLQAENGGIRMAPIGAYMPGRTDGRGWYELISTENNLSWYAAFRMLHQITGKWVYRNALDKLERYFQNVWNSDEGYFYQGMKYDRGVWHPETVDFATDVQTWGILVLGPETIDGWFGELSAHRMWQVVRHKSGSYTSSGALQGVGFTSEHDRVSVEWTAGAIFAVRVLAAYYEGSEKIHSALVQDAIQMRAGIEELRAHLPGGQSAYAYSSRRGWIPFGWYSHEPSVLSLASTAWVALLDADFNPFYLYGRPADQSLAGLYDLGKK